MSLLTHVSLSILDEELDSHGYFTILLHLNTKKNEIKSWSGQKCQKRSNFQNIYFLNKGMFLMQNLLSNPMVPIVFPYAG